MRCPNCQREVPSSAQNCYYCGAAMPYANPNSYQPPRVTKEHFTPTAVPTAFREFVKSPLILFAIIAYTVFAGIMLIKFFPMLKYIDECFDVIEYSFFLFVALISAMFLFVPPVSISLGLWCMYVSEGKEGAKSVNSGISTYIGLNISLLGSVLLFVVFNGGGSALAESFEDLIIPLAYGIFGLVATFWMHYFVDGVEFTAISGKANTDGIAKAGTLLLVYLALTLLAVFEVVDSMNLGASLAASFREEDDSLVTIANIAHLLALGLFGTAAHVYCNVIERAQMMDDEAERQGKKQTVPYQPAPQPMYQPVQQAPAQAARNDDAVTQLRQYKELLDSGVITQEDFDAKKKQLLGL